MAAVVAVMGGLAVPLAFGQGFFGAMPVLEPKDETAIEQAFEWIAGPQDAQRRGFRVIYQYGLGQASIVCAPLRICMVELGPSESIVEGGLHVGDLTRWQVDMVVGPGGRTYLVFKPTVPELDTTLVIITDRRIYHLRLVSHAFDYMPVVAFDYPSEPGRDYPRYKAQLAAVRGRETAGMETTPALEGLDFGYRISSCRPAGRRCSWRPQRVYTDGQRTIIDIGRDLSRTEAPALVVLTPWGDEQLVNYRMQEGRYVVDEVVDSAMLILGVGRRQQRVVITRLGSGQGGVDPVGRRPAAELPNTGRPQR